MPVQTPKAMRNAAAVFFVVMAFFASAQMVRAAAWPALAGRVVDTAGMLSPAAEAELDAALAAFEAKSSDQLVVVTIPGLDGAVLEDYANGLFRHWQLGQARQNNGVLLLIAQADRKVRIEVGYGLEGTLTDALSRLIIETVIVPNFRKGDFEAGIVQGASQIAGVLSGDSAELEERARRNAVQPGGDPAEWIITVIVGLWICFVIGSILFSFLAQAYGRRLGPGRYEWLGTEFDTRPSSGSGSGGGWSSGSSGGGFSGGGGSSGGGGASGGW